MGADNENAGFDADGITGLFNKAKTSGASYNFAFGLASKPEDCALLVHLRKAGKALKGEVKALPNKIGKTCFGTFTVAEGEVRFLPEKPAKGMIKALKKLFRENGMAKFKPMLVGPDGLEIDEESLPDDDGTGDEDEAVGSTAQTGADAPVAAERAAAAAQTPRQEPSATDPELTDLKRRLIAVLQQLPEVAPETANRLRQACTLASQQIAKPDAAAATGTIEQIEAVLMRLVQQKPAGPPAIPPEKLKEALAKLIPRIRALPNGEARGDLGTLAREVNALINDAAFDRAISALKALNRDLLAAEAGGGASAAPKVVAMEVWRNAKEECDRGIEALQGALRGYNDPDLNRIAEFGLNGLTDGMQVKLMIALTNFDRATGEARAKAAAALASRAAEVRAQLNGDPVVELCEKNPFGVAVAIRGPLGAALAELEQLARAA